MEKIKDNDFKFGMNFVFKPLKESGIVERDVYNPKTASANIEDLIIEKSLIWYKKGIERGMVNMIKNIDKGNIEFIKIGKKIHINVKLKKIRWPKKRIIINLEKKKLKKEINLQFDLEKLLKL